MKLTQTFVIVVFLVLIVALFYSLGERQIVVSNEAVNKVSVSGFAEKEVMPDEATLRLGVYTEGKDAESVQDRNSLAMNNVMKALEEAGVDKDQIETKRYYLYPKKEYDYELRKYVDQGYELQNVIEVKITEVEVAGNLLQVAVKNGVNQVENVAFGLSDEKEKEVKDELTQDAGKLAKEKAEALAKSLDVRLGEVLFINENSYNRGVYYASYDMAEVVGKEAAPQINPENVAVSISINVDFALK